jgi:uncharacterized protein (TIGR00299 family) protein
MCYLYFDLISGISGDMIVASLLDLAGGLAYLRSELKKINVGEYKIETFKRQSGHIRASCFEVKELSKRKRIFQLEEIKNKIKKSRLKPEIKKNILNIYKNLYEAEKKVHGQGKAHFEQIGEVDSLIDITASCLLIAKLKPERILYSGVAFGQKVSPATAQLLKSKGIYLTEHTYENITPTGVAIITTLGMQAKDRYDKDFIVGDIGYGAGSIQVNNSPNVLRTVLFKKGESSFEKDKAVVIQCNIDDMSPQVLGYLMDRLYEAGALEAYYETYYTKKSRIGFLISVLSKQESLDTITDIIFKETTTLGLRYFNVDRLKLTRKERILSSSQGKVKIKEVLNNRYKKIIPEYDDCVKVAKSRNMALKDVFFKLGRGE